MKCESAKRPFTRWRETLVLAGVAMLLAGCPDYWSVANLKDNPMDRAIATGDYAVHMKETRERLLKRFPIGQPVSRVSRYLESVGAKCGISKGVSGSVTCRYSQHKDTVFRTAFSEYLEHRRIYDFNIDLKHQRGLLRDVRVCRRITVIRYKGTLTDYSERIEYPFKCPKGQNKKGGI